MMAVSLGWPLKQASGFSDPGYYGIWNYVDHNPANPNQLLDYNCGGRTYDVSGYNHAGVDIFTWPFGWQKMDANQVEIIAAAAGTIVSKNDGANDKSCAFCTGCNANYVVVQHSDGSRAFYWHMKQGSVTSKSLGAAVVQGEYLGVVGSSGNSTGPHLHFEVWAGSTFSTLIDPYSGPCNSLNASSWWASQPAYWEPRLNKIMTATAPPVNSACYPDVLNASNSFSQGATVYFAAYLKDEKFNHTKTMKIYKPDNSVWQTWTHTPDPNNSTDYLDGSGWFWYFTLPSDAAVGTWRFEVAYQSQTVSHNFTVASTPMPNLTCQSAGSLSVNGTNLTVSNFVGKNSGNATAGASSLGYYLSLDGTITPADYLIGTDNVPSLAANGTSTQGLTVDVSTVSPAIPVGTYYVGMYLDRSSSVAESNEADNGCFFNAPQVVITPSGNCLPTYANPCSTGDYINDVAFHTINQVNTGCASPGASNYTNYTAVSTTVNTYNAYTITLKPGPNWGQYFVVMIDFNQDQDFFDVGEFFDVGYAAGGGSVSKSIAIPGNATLGNTRMRVLCQYNNIAITQAMICGSLTFGEVEDYSLVVQQGCAPNLSVSGNPVTAGTYKSAGVLTAQAATIANATTVMFLSDTGITLSPEFTVALGGVFEAVIQACPSSMAAPPEPKPKE